MIDYVGETKINERTVSNKISQGKDVFIELDEFKDKRQEHFMVLYLDGANIVLETRVISIGTINQSLVHPREVFAPAIELRACSIIIAHNHPSGVLKPSTEDFAVTKRLCKSGKLLGIEVLDHVIISKNGYLSMKDEELL
ncbi:MAG: JAB domain-containing protein [Campylobacterota bacterium]|nr:JAB domain-containing protein [Campylobacterota bacterium]